MKRRFPIKGILTVGVLTGCLLLSQTIISKADSGSTTGAGNIDDPLITKSYLDKVLSGLVQQEISKQLSGSGPSPSSPTPSNTPAAPAAMNITVIQLQAGQSLYAGAGAELIVRTGKTVAVSSDENGIPDVTAGIDIAANSPIELNHLLIFPRDGRGIKPDPKNKDDIYVMIRGNYIILNADGSKVTP